jgi:hypothetical protein
MLHALLIKTVMTCYYEIISLPVSTNKNFNRQVEEVFVGQSCYWTKGREEWHPLPHEATFSWIF